MVQLALWLSACPEIRLERTNFRDGAGTPPLLAVCGKTAGAYLNLSNPPGTFQWTSAVKAMLLLVLKAVADSTSQTTDSTISSPVHLSGGKGSPASSLDYAMTKQPMWVNDIFGLSRNGKSCIHRMFLRTNPGMKKGKEVRLSLNERYCDTDNIKIYLDEAELCLREKNDQLTLKQLISSLETNLNKRRKSNQKLVRSETTTSELSFDIDIENVSSDFENESIRRNGRTSSYNCSSSLKPVQACNADRAIGLASSNIADMITSLLVSYEQLCVKEICTQLRDIYSVTVRSSRLTAVLGRLCHEGIIEKCCDEYTMDTNWLDRLNCIHDSTLKILEMGDNKVSVEQGLLSFKIRFNTINQMENYLSEVHKECFSHSKPRNPTYWKLLHSWWPLVRPANEYGLSESFLDYPNISYVSSSGSAIDEWVSKFYAGLGINSKLRVSCSTDEDLWVADDIIVAQSLPPDIVEEIDDFITSYDGIADFDNVAFMKNYLNTNCDPVVRIGVAPGLAAGLRSNISTMLMN